MSILPPARYGVEPSTENIERMTKYSEQDWFDLFRSDQDMRRIVYFALEGNFNLSDEERAKAVEKLKRDEGWRMFPLTPERIQEDMRADQIQAEIFSLPNSNYLMVGAIITIFKRQVELSVVRSQEELADELEEINNEDD